MSATPAEWINLFARWFHVFAGILWVGQTYLFTWLDGRLRDATASSPAGERPQVWLLHSGGFYVVEKETRPGAYELHRFRWESFFTWLSGFVLLVLIYYHGGALIDQDVLNIRPWQGMLIGLGAIILGWVIYDLLCMTPLVNKQVLFAVITFLLSVATVFGLSHAFSGRAVYIHLGAIYGTIMTSNVWMRIIPAQRKMVAAAKEGREPDARLSEKAKLRSKHNTYMAVPVVFTMISNHFPVSTYGSQYSWQLLAIMILLGWGAAKLIRRA